VSVSTRSILLPAITIASILLSTLVGEGMIRLAALFCPSIEHLGNAGSGRMPPVIRDFADYRALHQNELRPHQAWHGYYLNGLGFNDQEFTPQKAEGTTRIIALGDSFLYSMVDYPNNVMTLLESKLSRDCGRGVEVLNFGVPGASTWDYKTLYSLEATRYQADLVLVHLYLGNDAPDTVNGKDWLPEPGRHSYLATLVRNMYRLKTGHGNETPRADAALENRGSAVGAGVVDGVPPLTDANPLLSKPPHTKEAWHRALKEELMRFYIPSDASTIERSWVRIFDILRELRAEVSTNGQQMVLVLYPSRLQIEDTVLSTAVATFEHRRAPNFSRSSIDVNLPAKTISAFGAREGITVIDLATEIRQAAGASEGSLYVPGDTHWNIAGNAVAARAEGAKLRDIVCR
jgi:hypothetical protein